VIQVYIHYLPYPRINASVFLVEALIVPIVSFNHQAPTMKDSPDKLTSTVFLLLKANNGMRDAVGKFSNSNLQFNR
jgi:hypothetical protein